MTQLKHSISLSNYFNELELDNSRCSWLQIRLFDNYKLNQKLYFQLSRWLDHWERGHPSPIRVGISVYLLKRNNENTIKKGKNSDSSTISLKRDCILVHGGNMNAISTLMPDLCQLPAFKLAVVAVASHARANSYIFQWRNYFKEKFLINCSQPTWIDFLKLIYLIALLIK